MSKRVLETLFSSRARVRLLKFLFRNYPKPYTLKDIAKHLQEDRGLVKKEIAHLSQVGLLVKVGPGKNHAKK
jgi:predicted transcriptional regulator